MTVFLVFTKYFGNISFLGAYATREGAEAFVQALDATGKSCWILQEPIAP